MTYVFIACMGISALIGVFLISAVIFGIKTGEVEGIQDVLSPILLAGILFCLAAIGLHLWGGQ